MYCLSQIGQLGRKGKDKAIFGTDEALIMVQHMLPEASGRQLTFNLQVSVMLLLIVYTGVRPGSLLAQDKVANSEFLKWKVSFQSFDRNPTYCHIIYMRY